MPAVVNIGANLCLGGALAIALRNSPALHRELVSWPFLVLAAFQGIVVTPIATYLFRFYPQWSMSYLFDPQVFPQLDLWVGPLSALVVLATMGAGFAGYALARAGIVGEQRWLALLPAVSGGLAVAAVVLFYRSRVFFVGEYDDFWQGHARFFLSSTAGWVGVALYVASLTLLWFVRSRFAHREPQFI